MPTIDTTGKPFDFKGRSYVALAPIVRQLGGDVEWNNETKKATVTLDGHTANVQMANENIEIDGRTQTINGTPLVVDDTLIVPQVFFGDVFNRPV
jgi:hypothetical protein